MSKYKPNTGSKVADFLILRAMGEDVQISLPEPVEPLPDHEMGYTHAYLRKHLGDRWDAFSNWMDGQTVAIDVNLGPVYYTYDVQKFLRNDLKVYD